MDELLQKLLEADVLSEETKTELESAFKIKMDEALDTAKAEATADVRADLTEQWVGERDQLIEAVDAKVTEFLSKEVDELKEDIERFRDLEAEYAEKLIEAKAAMSDELKDDLLELVEKVDAFLEIRLGAEIDELREDLNNVRKNDFGRRVFEAFADEFTVNYADKDSAENTLRETTERLNDVQAALEESENQRKAVERKITMESVLSPLAGRKREVMEAILRNVETESLVEGYKTFIGRVLRETDDSEKENTVLAEKKEEKCDDDVDDKKSEKDKKKDKKDKKIVEGKVVSGDVDEVIMETEEVDEAKNASLAYVRKMAGIV